MNNFNLLNPKGTATNNFYIENTVAFEKYEIDKLIGFEGTASFMTDNPEKPI
jgi:hypothetical protein